MEPVGVEEPAGPAGQQGPPGSQGLQEDLGIPAPVGAGLSGSVDNLTTEVRALRGEVSEYNETAVSARRIALWVAVSLLVSILLGVGAIGGAYVLIDRNNHRWCGTLNILTDPTAPPPTTARGRDQLKQLEQLRVAFNCRRDA